MPTYRIDLPAGGNAIFQQVESDSETLQLLVPVSNKALISSITEHGAEAFYQHPQFNKAQLDKIINGKTITAFTDHESLRVLTLQ
ncbi:hypothetical protein A8A01_20995 [Ewingella americana]|nr:hypothetical protein A8A01_20995 [Ewingella americana]